MISTALDADIDEDQHVLMSRMTWRDYEALLEIRGERPQPKVFYLDGAIEIMTTSETHEWRKATLARLLELWAVELDIELTAYRSKTLKRRAKKAGVEPDECYNVGAYKRFPDLVIEVEWSRMVGIDKHEIYARLGIRELWTLRRDLTLVVRVLENGTYHVRKRSKVLPMLDLQWLRSYLDEGNQHRAVRALRNALRARAQT